MEYLKLEMSQEEFKRQLLEGMIMAAELFQEMADPEGEIVGSFEFKSVPLSFKPTLADRMKFRHTIEEIFPFLIDEYCKSDVNTILMGCQIYAKRYYPHYGQYIEKTLEEEFKELRKS